MGKFNKKRADQSFGFGLLMSIVVGIPLFLLVLFFGDVYLKSYSPEPDVLAQAQGYLFWMQYVILTMPIQMLIANMVYSDGDETISTVANVVQGIGNIRGVAVLALSCRSKIRAAATARAVTVRSAAGIALPGSA